MEKEFGKNLKEFLTLIKVNILMIKNTDTVFSPGQTVVLTKEIIRMISDKVMDRCFGSMVLFIKVNG